MDSDFWTSRLAAAKRQYNLQHHHQSSHLDRLSIDDFEVEDEVRPDFPCPYCYEDFDIASLCSHLEDEHPCESKVTVANVMLENELVVYAIGKGGGISIWYMPWMMERRRRLRRVAIPNSQALSLLGRDLHEAHLQVLLEEITKSVVTSAEDTAAKNVATAHMWKSSFDPSLSYEEREKRIQQATGRAGFVQDLFLSTLLND
ncbi:hypothetical protein REPUB_Repub14bG0122200 [Reevesia pubescens]